MPPSKGIRALDFSVVLSFWIWFAMRVHSPTAGVGVPPVLHLGLCGLARRFIIRLWPHLVILWLFRTQQSLLVSAHEYLLVWAYSSFVVGVAPKGGSPFCPPVLLLLSLACLW